METPTAAPIATTTLTMSEAINRALREALDRPEPMMLIGQDIGPYGGTFGVTRGLHDDYGEEVIRDAPLAESGTVGYAIGLAITGVRAVCEIEFFDFVGVAMDQIFNQAAKLHYFTGGKLTVPLVIRTPIVARMGMGPQHSQSLESWFMHIPGIKIAVPSNASDAYGLLRSALADSNPVLFVENVRLYGRRGEVDLEAEPIPFGQARIAREGDGRHRRRALEHGRRGARRRRPARGGGSLGRGDRPADARAARHGDDPRLAAEDDAARGRTRRAPDARLRRRDRGPLHGGGVRLPRRARRARRLQRRADPVHAERDRGRLSERRRRRRRRPAPGRMTALLVPQLSISMEEAKVSRWLVDDGHPVAAGQIVVEVETDKATVEIEAPEAGLLRIVAAEGEVVAVDGVLAEVEPAGWHRRRGRRLRSRPLPPRRRRAERPAPVTAMPRRGGPIASPAARRLAREQGVELAGVQGTGPGGRIVARDLAAASGTPAPPD